MQLETVSLLCRHLAAAFYTAKIITEAKSEITTSSRVLWTLVKFFFATLLVHIWYPYGYLYELNHVNTKTVFRFVDKKEESKLTFFSKSTCYKLHSFFRGIICLPLLVYLDFVQISRLSNKPFQTQMLNIYQNLSRKHSCVSDLSNLHSLQKEEIF